MKLDKFVLASFLIFGLLLQGATYSTVLSFLEAHCASVGLSTAQYGVIIGIYSVVTLAITPFGAQFVAQTRLSGKFVMVTVYLVDAFAMLAACLIDTYHLSGKWFFVAMLCQRLIQSSAGSIGCLYVYYINSVELKQIQHITLPILESVYGAAIIVGPLAGGFAYDYGGFMAPFLQAGGVLTAYGLLAAVFFPSVNETEEASSVLSFRQFLSPAVTLSIATVLLSCAFLSFNESSLATLLTKFGLSPSLIGLSYLLPAGVCLTSGVLGGWLSKRLNKRYLICLSLVLVSIGFILVDGSSYQGPMNHSLTNAFIGEGVLALGLGPLHVLCFICISEELSYIGDVKATAATTSMLTLTACSCGYILGPIIGNWIIDAYSYGIAVLVMACTAFCTGSANLAYELTLSRCSKKIDDIV